MLQMNSFSRQVKLVRHEVDFIKANGRAVKAHSLQRSPSLTALDDLKRRKEEEERSYQRGVVPRYLLQRKEQRAQEEAAKRASQPDPDMPPGHRKMADEERHETLKRLQESQQQLLLQLGQLPVRSDTLTLRRRKEEIEGRLAEVEEAIKIFSRPKVFVKLDT